MAVDDKSENADSELMTTREVARVLRVKEKTLYGWSYGSQGPLKPVRFRSGSRHIVRWKRRDVEKLLGED